MSIAGSATSVNGMTSSSSSVPEVLPGSESISPPLSSVEPSEVTSAALLTGSVRVAAVMV